MNTAKIYFNENPLILTDNTEENAPSGVRHLNRPTEKEIKKLIAEMQYDNARATLLTSDNFKSLEQSVYGHFQIIQAGGGIVFNTDGAVLLIFRRGKWDLPKGKLDEGETMEACALREVEEETGLSQLSIRNFFGITRHVYEEKNKLLLKETHWYQMDYQGNEKLIPQEEESISAAIWVMPADLDAYLENTFPSIEEIFGQWNERMI